MNALARRKQELLHECELHRQLIALERLQLGWRWRQTRGSLRRQQPWLLAAAAIAGAVALPRLGRLARWLPTILALWRGFRR